jgi:hypothetical protein
MNQSLPLFLHAEGYSLQIQNLFICFEMVYRSGQDKGQGGAEKQATGLKESVSAKATSGWLVVSED